MFPTATCAILAGTAIALLAHYLSPALLAVPSSGTVQDQKKTDTLRQQLEDNLPTERWFYEDWEKAKKEASKSGKPIFVVFRCVP